MGLIPAFQYLPLLMDRTEAKICHKIFVVTLDQNQEHILGSQQENLVTVIKLFLQLFEHRDKVCDNDTVQYIQNFLHNLGKNPQHLQRHAASFLPNEIQLLQRIINASSI